MATAAATQTSICQISAQFFNLGHFSQCTQSSSGFELHIIDDKSTKIENWGNG